MCATIAEQLSMVPLLSTTLRVDVDLVEAAPSFQLASVILQEWVDRKSRQFRLDPSLGATDCSIRERDIQLEWSSDSDSRAFSVSHRDPTADGRTWIIEGYIETHDMKTRMCTRIGFRQPRNSMQPSPRAPRFLSNIVKDVGAIDFRHLEDKAYEISSPNFGEFDELLFSQRRRLPIVVVSEDQRTDAYPVDAEVLASYLCGVAHVARIDATASKWLTERLGSKELSVFHGGVRCYVSGFSTNDDIYRHKLWTREAISRLDASRKDGFLNWCLGHTFSVVTSEFEPFEMLSPSGVRRKRTEREVVAAMMRGAPVQDSGIEQEVVVSDTVDPCSSIESAIELPDQAVEPEIKFTVNDDSGVLEIAGLEGLGESPIFDVEHIRLIENLFRQSRERKIAELQGEIERLEKMLQEARDDTAQKNREIMRLAPFEQQSADLIEERNLLRGEYEVKDSKALQDFWDGFNIFFESAQTLASEARRVKAQESTIEQMESEVRGLKESLYQRDSRIEALLQDDDEVLSIKLQKLDSWTALLENSSIEHKLLIPSFEISELLATHPFNEGLASSVYELMGLLNALAQESNNDSSLTEAGIRIHQANFVGKNASFSDESETNKRAFRKELTFPDPTDTLKRIECPWHGKISQDQFRIHFEWPRPKGQREIKIVYVGPKITKH